MSFCRDNLANGRYRWRHDKVLTEITEFLETEKKRKKQVKDTKKIGFVRTGEPPKNIKAEQTGILSSAGDW